MEIRNIGDRPSEHESGSTSQSGGEKYPENEEVHEFSLDEELASYTNRGVELRNFRWDTIPEEDREGVVGTVENKRDSEIADIRVSVDFYDGDTQIGSGWQMPTFLGSSEYARIGIPPTHVDNPERITRVGLSSTVRVESLTPLNDGEVTVTDNFQKNANPPVVSGIVTNVIDERLSRVYIEIGFLDENELVYWRTDGISRLGPGDSGEWEVEAGQHVESVTDYKRHIKVQQ